MEIKIQRLNHVQICIPIGEENRARDFYGRILGVEEIEKPDVLKPGGGIWVKNADIQLHIGVEPDQSPSKRHPAFEVEDLEGIKGFLGENGVRLRDEKTAQGMKRFSFFDPFGN